MTAPIVFSDAPPQPRWHRAISAPLVGSANVLAAAWLLPCVKTVRVEWHPGREALLELLEERARPVILYTWHVYEALVLCAFHRFPARLMPEGIGHDGMASRMLQRAVAWSGIPVFVYRRRSSVGPRRQLIEHIQSGSPSRVMGLVTDAGGPYGQTKPGILEVARETGAQLIPIAARSKPLLLLKRPARYAFPVPFSRMDIHYGAPLDGSTVELSECRSALMEVDRKAHGIWSGS